LRVWPSILDRSGVPLPGATPLRCTGKLQREESVIHVVAERLEDLTSRLSLLRDRTGDAGTGHAPKPPFASAAKPPGYDPREIVTASRNFR
jgi:error-prone DNA polymerase